MFLTYLETPIENQKNGIIDDEQFPRDRTF